MPHDCTADDWDAFRSRRSPPPEADPSDDPTEEQDSEDEESTGTKS